MEKGLSEKMTVIYYYTLYQIAQEQLRDYKEQNPEPKEDDRILANLEHSVLSLKKMNFEFVENQFKGIVLR